MKSKVILSISLAIVSSASYALEAFVGKVTLVEPSYLPGTVALQMDSGNTTCPSGTWLFWRNADPQNNKAVYATLMTALATGKQVRFHINDNDSTCTGKHLHLLN